MSEEDIGRDSTGKRRRISRELPPAGTKLEGRSRGQVYEATVVKSSTDPRRRTVRFRDREFSSLSGAARAVTGHAVNGWLFWKVRDKS